jgi:hypothetical protein
MRKIFYLTTAAAGLALAGVAVKADPERNPASVAMNVQAGKTGASSQLTPAKAGDKLYDYCARGLDHMKKGKPFPRDAAYSAGDCVDIFISASIPGPGDVTAAEPGQPGRGGDGGGIAGMPGGKGGAAGRPGQDGAGLPGAAGGKGGAAGRAGGSDTAVDEELLDYCSAMLQRPRPGSAAQTPAESDAYAPSDCMDYFASLDAPKAGGAASSARDGAAGLSVGGGQGGEGGKRGGGPGGASGGAGGAGVGGGTGGKGGAGGSGY